jgi:hypothetical protein
MLKILLKILKWIALTVVAVIGLMVAVSAVWYFSADMKQPDIRVDTLDYRVAIHDGWKESRGNMFRSSDSGLWEAYLHGKALERGAALGRMTEDLLYYQEKVFIDQIHRIIPSDGYLKFLRYLLIGFNRNLGENVPEEFREEIYGISLSCTHEFDAIGNPYERQLNYHAAHDIGHTMQEYMLVGCSSFAAWGSRSADSTLIIGRNFDFWVGDDFARNKIVAFYAPEKGHKFASVTWPGMTGVLSGMNDKGLTVTINAAKGSPPISSAMPISLLAREILQYAATIDEAMAIAESRNTFVSESLLIGSAVDGRAAVIEKSPRQTALYLPDGEYLICTNHYQSPTFAADKYNVENIATSDSPYRFRRIEELMTAIGTIEPAGAAAILRDRLGTDGEDIGPDNPRSINQTFAHHSVIFKPRELLMWVCAAPGLRKEYVCYDLKKIFDAPDFATELRDATKTIPAQR